MIPDMEALVGNTIARILADKGYRGHDAPPDHEFRVFISGQKRGVTPKISVNCAAGPPSNSVAIPVQHRPFGRDAGFHCAAAYNC
ncbi:hypothetical protein ACVWXO_000876 [Bradyrhizobium sp. LM2.7]